MFLWSLVLQAVYKYISKYIRLKGAIRLLFVGFIKFFLAPFVLSFFKQYISQNLYKLITFIILIYIYPSLVEKEEKVLESFSASLREYIHNKLFKVFLKKIPQSTINRIIIVIFPYFKLNIVYNIIIGYSLYINPVLLLFCFFTPILRGRSHFIWL